MTDKEKDIHERGLANKLIVLYNDQGYEPAKKQIQSLLDEGLSVFDVFDAFRKLAQVNNDFDLEIAICRAAFQAGHRHSSFSSHLMEALRLSGRPALISDFLRDIDYTTLGRFFFVSGYRMSGVEKLVSILSTMTGKPRIALRNEPFENEQYLFPPLMAYAAKQDNVSGHNLIATEPDIQLMQAFAVRPVILRRNIFDALGGLCIHAETTEGGYRGFFAVPHFQDMDEETRMDAILHRFGPAYVDFYVSWQRVKTKDRLDTLWIDFEDLWQNTSDTVKKVLDFYDTEFDDSALTPFKDKFFPDSDLDSPTYGIGKGRDRLNKRQKEALKQSTRFYPDIDFSPIGL